MFVRPKRFMEKILWDPRTDPRLPGLPQCIFTHNFGQNGLLFRCKVDGFVPRTWHVNVRIVCQADPRKAEPEGQHAAGVAGERGRMRTAQSQRLLESQARLPLC